MLQFNYKGINIKFIFSAIFLSIGIGIILLYVNTHTLNHTFFKYVLNSAYSLCIGVGLFSNNYIFNTIGKRFISWTEKPVKSIFIVIILHLSYSTVIIWLFNWLYFIIILDWPKATFWDDNKYTIISEYIILIIITAILYAQSFFNEYKEEAIQSEKLKQEAIRLQLQILQNQVNPHFLFNSLNILASLIDIDQKKAKEFTQELSLFYRELLRFKDKEIISLQEEIAFIKKYIYLQKIRFGTNLNVDILLNDDIKGEVIPMSIQMLLENAVKHNIISKDKPLKVEIGQTTEEEIFVTNNLQLKRNLEESNKIGLKNLQKRYKYLTNNEMKIINHGNTFKVTIPLIKLEE